MNSMNVSRETLGPMKPFERDELIDAASRLKIEVTNDQAACLIDYLNELRRWNQRINLIGPSKPEDQIVLHLVDSLAPLNLLPKAPLEILDLGSGAGLPGVVLAIMRPRWRITMAETRAKKVDFIRHAVRSLGIDNARVAQVRLGKDKPDFGPKTFDLATFRALGHLKDLIPLVVPYVKDSGQILAYKGPDGMDEWNESEHIVNKAGLRLSRVEEIILPKLGHRRLLLFFNRKG
jgi:16S rRNA (guanine527-N7)-methyltransferase